MVHGGLCRIPLAAPSPIGESAVGSVVVPARRATPRHAARACDAPDPPIPAPDQQATQETR
jgi:hypothetical protein